jgi:hypothetical protein
MILRRLTKHVEDQNWFAVALDFVIVVAGILLAFQITNWSVDRSELAQAASIRANIIEDLRSDEDTLSEGTAYAELNVRAANFTLNAAERQLASILEFSVDSADGMANTIIAPDWQQLDRTLTHRLWSLVVVRYHPAQSNAAFGSLVSGGNLNQIRDPALVAKLQRYQRRWRDLEIAQDTTFRPIRNQTLFVGQKFGLSAFVDMPEADFVTLIRKTPELEASLRTLAEYALLHHQQLVFMQGETRALLRYLGEDLAP